MAAQGSVKSMFSFLGGLNTEGGIFITPENSWVEGQNVVPDQNGVIGRRNGLDFPSVVSYIDTVEYGPQTTTPSYMSTTAYSTDLWTTVNGNGGLNFLCYQIGEYIYFTNSSSENPNTQSAHVKNRINLLDYATGGATVAGVRAAVASFAPIFGRLIITTEFTNPILVTYDSVTNEVSAEVITIKVRDFDGFTSPVAVDVEKTQAEWAALGFYEQALYNLYNQGWTDTQINAYKTANSNKLPANSKQWIYGKDSTDTFSAAFLAKQDFGSSQAPRGRFILEAFNKTRTANAVTFTDSTNARPAACCFFAGRVWYAGVNNQADGGKIFYSQVCDTIDKAGNCYQTNDPTSEVLSDLEADDGGVLPIPEANNIRKLVPLGNGVMVIASNGVWFISGADATFSAQNIAADKITNIGCISANSVVEVESACFYWSTAGIYVIEYDASSGKYGATNASDKAIRTFYDDIPTLNKRASTGAYNSRTKQIFWLFSDEIKESAADNLASKNAILVLDLKLKNYYWFKLDNTKNGIPIEVISTTEASSAFEEADAVLAGGDTVFAGGDKVVTTIPLSKAQRKIFKILCTYNLSGTLVHSFADFENTRTAATKFYDFYTRNGTNFEDAIEVESYIVTGHQMGDNGPARKKTAQYITVFLKKTETGIDDDEEPINGSSCILESRWDFTNSNVANKWSSPQQVYRNPRGYLTDPEDNYDEGYSVVVSKNKIRGRGKAVQLKFGSQTGKDMQLLGWSSNFVGNQNV